MILERSEDALCLSWDPRGENALEAPRSACAGLGQQQQQHLLQHCLPSAPPHGAWRVLVSCLDES